MSYDELKNLSTDELTDRLIEMDYVLMQNHRNGHYTKNPWVDSMADEDEKQRAKNMDIIGLCITGISAYNGLTLPNANDREGFLTGIIQNLEVYFEHGNIPSFMQKYYIDVLNRKNIDYLNNYLLKYSNENEEGQEKGRTLSKSTAAGRFLSDKEAAFVSVLILPAMLALIYISIVVIYFIFFYNGG